jgi:hypothetical protein
MVGPSVHEREQLDGPSRDVDVAQDLELILNTLCPVVVHEGASEKAFHLLVRSAPSFRPLSA